jgi:hypothetical protein
MARKPTARKGNRTPKLRRTRAKLDSRLALLLSLSEKQLRTLKGEEDARLDGIAKEIGEAVAALDRAKGRDRESIVERLRKLDRRLFAPLTTGLFIPPQGRHEKWGPISMKEPFAAVFVLSVASADDLKRLGVRVRSRVGDIFSAFVPLSAIPRLEESAAIRYVELARPMFQTLNQAVPFAQINTLHTAVPPVTGAGVVVGVVDSRLDIYHPDFRTAANATRVLFLWDQSLNP